MNQDIAGISSNLDKTVKAQQFDKVVEAILAGKYSWACVLMLRFGGYNPLHYIPYRTYNRLLKENSQADRTKQQQNENLKMLKHAHNSQSDNNASSSCLSKIKDVAYLEVVRKQKAEIRAGSLDQRLTHQINEHQSSKSPLKPENVQDISLKSCGFN
ncbi:MAG: HetP family heterocyst commitment protein [Nostoc sp. DedQUE08]|uniref:HetP family heterocyst commitment protein n=1 Tax=unclassified Nostoc TaxID=2593658 RepID=UPI002AD351E1|nr:MULTISPECIES: HetP family heterocyst commitment protein [unclassified Nostoc]MDZ8070742.1 HetP family heterocyst commitment protein [Nostoc sp. DedQUE08]MDZ8092191.1 HetP family heterocyst commitment protein [Nostoc sp. DedQUE05]